MKVILIKDCKAGQKNEIINVADGYAKNFLIKNNYALPVNAKTKQKLEQILKQNQIQADQKAANALTVKTAIEKLTPRFKLKVVNDKIHGSITRKQIIKFLKGHNVIVDNHMVENIKIDTLGITSLKIFLTSKITAILKVEVKNG